MIKRNQKCEYGDQKCPCLTTRSDNVSDRTVFPTLYKLNRSKSLSYWQIGTLGFVINTSYGQLGTEKPAQLAEIIKEGKNQGRSNETTPVEQAHNRARSRWNKKIDEGFTADLAKAKRGEDEIGVPKAMLAEEFEESEHRLYWPVYGSKKLDGMRCIAYREAQDTPVRLYSRGRKLIVSAPHIVKELTRALKRFPGKIVLDGELYNHEIRCSGDEEFEKLMSIARQTKQLDPDYERLEYHIFDAPFVEGKIEYITRFRKRKGWLKDEFFAEEYTYLKRVKHVMLHDGDMAREMFAKYRKLGYEGLMLRSADSPYIEGRSMQLQKFKGFFDAEFEVVDVVPGEGKAATHGTLVCAYPGGTFNCDMKWTAAKREELLRLKRRFIGKMVTVRYQELTGKNKKPRHPRGLRFREEGY